MEAWEAEYFLLPLAAVLRGTMSGGCVRPLQSEEEVERLMELGKTELTESSPHRTDCQRREIVCLGERAGGGKGELL